MSESVKMPALGESVTEGTVTRWLKAVGESVEVDEPLLEVSTDKVDTEVPSPVAGVVEKILVEEDETVEVGTELAVVGDGSGASGSDEAPEAEAPEAEAPSEAPASEEVEAAQPESEAAEPAEEAKEEATESAPASGSSEASGDAEGEAVKMPALGESVTEGTVTRWLKAEGDTVEVDEPLLEVSTDKVDTEVPSPVAGTVVKILVGEDETVEVGTDLAIVGSGAAAPKAEAPKEEPKAEEPEAEKAEEPKAEAPKEEPKAEEPQEEPKPEAPKEEPKAEAPREEPKAEAPKAAAAAGTAYITPLVRKLAGEKGVDLSTLTGTGVGGRIRKQDVEAAAEKAAAEKAAAQAPAGAPAGAGAAKPAPVEVSPLRGTTEKMSRLRKVISKRMRESLDTSAQLTSVMEVDVTRIAALRGRAKGSFQAAEGTKLTFLPFFVKAATEALKSHPKLNATIDGEQVVYHGAEHIGIAVDTPRGLLVPVIKDAGDLTIGGIAKRINDLAARTRDSKVTPDELSGSTFTITNTGSAGLLIDTPIINQPEVAILGVGTIVKRPAVVKDAEGNDTIGIRSIIYLSLTYDHRLVDGADAGRFLQTVKARLEEGAFDAEVGL
ncbi:2-oxoglutarate dehydrogenase, E2 component, dihydrolipoamide succinyltransferase [Georgenia subflava]|uniref:Dihydrolipoamide acetyltransferase component of pyruvate dehydrogenase complex n=1 Tax=Georgenia subflava TaxID=1622177 RepID=A0A6N7EHP6_9MICO|nr:2-oxoglutarate dehydrogenase, E2 component, dihydrolipoamide succinyltransferase [Georgenia subflava]MPV37649.1 2-oxoglutarate dehydrogenase, E2 component, dihydrolipoamide succinyltransferase [Georgenia subflava]